MNSHVCLPPRLNDFYYIFDAPITKRKIMKKTVYLMMVIVLGLFATNSVQAQDLRKSGSKFGKIESNGGVRIKGSIKGKFESNGNIRVNGSVKGKIESNGNIRKNGSIIGKIESNGDVRINGSIKGKIESNGNVRKSGSVIGSAKGVDKRQAAVIFFFEFFEF